ncbi:glycosyltransferase [Marinomonas sp. PE14-40]|uniref:glycosyltransferase n=1 Tax=Marinomonas sp. PE14-40 TaxID=3060621 RepID=UPI003F665969
MRIAVVVHTLKMGGMERVATSLADAFVQSGHKCDLVYLKDRKVDLKPNTDVPVHLFNLKRAALGKFHGPICFLGSKILNAIFRKSNLLWFNRLEAKVFESKLKALEVKNGSAFDLVIFRGQGTFEHVWILNDSRFVFVCENVQKKYMYKGLSKKVFHSLFDYRNVACVSTGALDSFLDMAKTHNLAYKKAIMLSNPCDFNFIRESAKSKESVHVKPFILGLGRLVHQKNFSLLVEAFAIARKKYHIEHDLLIVGSGPDEVIIRKKVNELDLDSSVHFKGSVSEPFHYYKQSDLYVLSSKHEGLGMVLLEALAVQTKVIATDSPGGVRQIMNGELELFLSEMAPNALAQKIAFALSFKETEEYTKDVERVLSQFDRFNIVEKYIEEFV